MEKFHNFTSHHSSSSRMQEKRPISNMADIFSEGPSKRRGEIMTVTIDDDDVIKSSDNDKKRLEASNSSLRNKAVNTNSKCNNGGRSVGFYNGCTAIAPKPTSEPFRYGSFLNYKSPLQYSSELAPSNGIQKPSGIFNRHLVMSRYKTIYPKNKRVISHGNQNERYQNVATGDSSISSPDFKTGRPYLSTGYLGSICRGCGSLVMAIPSENSHPSGCPRPVACLCGTVTFFETELSAIEQDRKNDSKSFEASKNCAKDASTSRVSVSRQERGNFQPRMDQCSVNPCSKICIESVVSLRKTDDDVIKEISKNLSSCLCCSTNGQAHSESKVAISENSPEDYGNDLRRDVTKYDTPTSFNYISLTSDYLDDDGKLVIDEDRCEASNTDDNQTETESPICIPQASWTMRESDYHNIGFTKVKPVKENKTRTTIYMSSSHKFKKSRRKWKKNKSSCRKCGTKLANINRLLCSNCKKMLELQRKINKQVRELRARGILPKNKTASSSTAYLENYNHADIDIYREEDVNCQLNCKPYVAEKTSDIDRTMHFTSKTYQQVGEVMVSCKTQSLLKGMSLITFDDMDDNSKDYVRDLEKKDVPNSTSNSCFVEVLEQQSIKCFGGDGNQTESRNPESLRNIILPMFGNAAEVKTIDESVAVSNKAITSPVTDYDQFDVSCSSNEELSEETKQVVAKTQPILLKREEPLTSHMIFAIITEDKSYQDSLKILTAKIRTLSCDLERVLLISLELKNNPKITETIKMERCFLFYCSYFRMLSQKFSQEMLSKFLFANFFNNKGILCRILDFSEKVESQKLLAITSRNATSKNPTFCVKGNDSNRCHRNSFEEKTSSSKILHDIPRNIMSEVSTDLNLLRSALRAEDPHSKVGPLAELKELACVSNVDLPIVKDDSGEEVTTKRTSERKAGSFVSQNVKNGEFLKAISAVSKSDFLKTKVNNSSLRSKSNGHVRSFDLRTILQMSNGRDKHKPSEDVLSSSKKDTAGKNDQDFNDYIRLSTGDVSGSKSEANSSYLVDDNSASALFSRHYEYIRNSYFASQLQVRGSTSWHSTVNYNDASIRSGSSQQWKKPDDNFSEVKYRPCETIVDNVAEKEQRRYSGIVANTVQTPSLKHFGASVARRQPEITVDHKHVIRDKISLTGNGNNISNVKTRLSDLLNTSSKRADVEHYLKSKYSAKPLTNSVPQLLKSNEKNNVKYASGNTLLTCERKAETPFGGGSFLNIKSDVDEATSLAKTETKTENGNKPLKYVDTNLGPLIMKSKCESEKFKMEDLNSGKTALRSGLCSLPTSTSNAVSLFSVKLPSDNKKDIVRPKSLSSLDKKSIPPLKSNNNFAHKSNGIESVFESDSHPMSKYPRNNRFEDCGSMDTSRTSARVLRSHKNESLTGIVKNVAGGFWNVQKKQPPEAGLKTPSTLTWNGDQNSNISNSKLNQITTSTNDKYRSLQIDMNYHSSLLAENELKHCIASSIKRSPTSSEVTVGKNSSQSFLNPSATYDCLSRNLLVPNLNTSSSSDKLGLYKPYAITRQNESKSVPSIDMITDPFLLLPLQTVPSSEMSNFGSLSQGLPVRRQPHADTYRERVSFENKEKSLLTRNDHMERVLDLSMHQATKDNIQQPVRIVKPKPIKLSVCGPSKTGSYFQQEDSSLRPLPKLIPLEPIVDGRNHDFVTMNSLKTSDPTYFSSRVPSSENMLQRNVHHWKLRFSQNIVKDQNPIYRTVCQHDQASSLDNQSYRTPKEVDNRMQKKDSTHQSDIKLHHQNSSSHSSEAMKRKLQTQWNDVVEAPTKIRRESVNLASDSPKDSWFSYRGLLLDYALLASRGYVNPPPLLLQGVSDTRAKNTYQINQN